MNIDAILIRFLVVFSLLFGIERQRSHKPIGFGTYTFVAIGSCALSITALTTNPENPLPLVAAIVTGIGFLGAGALIKTSDKIFGFTTASSIWVFSILGLVIGLGEYFIGVILYSLLWFVIFYDQYLERKNIGSYQRKITILTNRLIPTREIESVLGECLRKYKFFTVEMSKKNSTLSIVYLIEGEKERMNQLPGLLFKKDWFDSCKVE